MKRILFFAAVALGTAGLFTAGLALSATGDVALTLKAKLGAAQEVPAPKGATRGTGTFKATLANRGRTLTWRLTFTGLTGKALAAHIHLGKPGVAGPVAAPLCGPCVSGAHGTLTVSTKLRSALTSGRAYVNVHTSKNPGGEICGQVSDGAGAGGSPAPAGTVTGGAATTIDSGGYGYG